MSSILDRLRELAGNLRWTWHAEFEPLFREIDEQLWREVTHNPTDFLARVDAEKLSAKSLDPHYRVRLEKACAFLRASLESDRHWAAWSAPGLAARPVAYFSAEFGLHESLPIYSGGLGVLAGDHIKSASDLGLPMYGVSILYRQGYFRQLIDADGRQEEMYQDMDLETMAVEPVLDPQGQHISIHYPVNSGKIDIQLWRTRVGRANLILLDVNQPRDVKEPKNLTRRLYEGDPPTRLVQELILGAGGLRALRALGVKPGALHLNEGHSAFAILEAVANSMEEEGLSFEEASERISRTIVFTTHTPVAAGHDRFSSDLIRRFCEPLRERLNLTHERFMDLGRVRPGDAREFFCMTVLALKFAHRSNAVSSLHGETSRRMWKELWPDRRLGEVPIGHITNGVHVPSWVAPEMAALYDRHLGPSWQTNQCRPELWNRIPLIDPFVIWDAKCALRQKMLVFVERRMQYRRNRLGMEDEAAHINPEALTIGFVRRFVEYKRATLLFKDPDRLARILSNPERPVQIIFAGKAHPHDDFGKGVLTEVHRWTQDPRFKGKVLLLENHDMNMSRHLLQGCDLWLNNPRRPLEACGTSGQKAVFNATLNLSILDGWWAEAFDQQNGYAFGGGLTHTDPAKQDERDAKDLYDVLENQVLPDFFDRSSEGIPLRWMAKIQHALSTLAWRYNADRMVIDYVKRCYLATTGSLTADFPNAG
ncbi:MAG: alpha-glucan family phosphorylase [Pseudomonadota bacterium]